MIKITLTLQNRNCTYVSQKAEVSDAIWDMLSAIKQSFGPVRYRIKKIEKDALEI
jgi:hypothetical protein